MPILSCFGTLLRSGDLHVDALRGPLPFHRSLLHFRVGEESKSLSHVDRLVSSASPHRTLRHCQGISRQNRPVRQTVTITKDILHIILPCTTAFSNT